VHGGGKRRHYYIRMTGIAYIVVAALASAMWRLPPPCGACLRHVVLASAMWCLPPPCGACLRHMVLASAMWRLPPPCCPVSVMWCLQKTAQKAPVIYTGDE